MVRRVARAVTNAPVSAGSYALSETGGPAGYAASAWSCVGGTQTGASIALALGESATCTINNNDIAAQLTLVKTVTNDNGGTALADRVDVARDGPTPIGGATGSARGDERAGECGKLRAVGVGGPAGYAASAWSCVGGTQTGASIALALGRVGDVHDQQRRHGRAVDVGEDGDERQRRHRAADGVDVDARRGRRRSSGATGSAAVTSAPVSAGTLRVVGDGGPAGYAASAWSCVGGTQTGASIALALGESATCTINNDDIPASLTLVKQVVNDDGGTAVATDWTLTATGPTAGCDRADR